MAKIIKKEDLEFKKDRLVYDDEIVTPGPIGEEMDLLCAMIVTNDAIKEMIENGKIPDNSVKVASITVQPKSKKDRIVPKMKTPILDKEVENAAKRFEEISNSRNADEADKLAKTLFPYLIEFIEDDEIVIDDGRVCTCKLMADPTKVTIEVIAEACLTWIETEEERGAVVVDYEDMIDPIEWIKDIKYRNQL